MSNKWVKKWGKRAKATFHKMVEKNWKLENELSAEIIGKMRIFWGNARWLGTNEIPNWTDWLRFRCFGNLLWQSWLRVWSKNTLWWAFRRVLKCWWVWRIRNVWENRNAAQVGKFKQWMNSLWCAWMFGKMQMLGIGKMQMPFWGNFEIFISKYCLGNFEMVLGISKCFGEFKCFLGNFELQLANSKWWENEFPKQIELNDF